MHVPRMLRAIACLALLTPIRLLAQVPATIAQEPTLHSLVEDAWLRSPIARTLLARQDEVRAGHALAGSWVAGAPVLGLSQRSDRWTDQRDRSESEISLSASIWLPHQKTRRATLAQAGIDEIETLIKQARLEIAGQVRVRLWEAAASAETLRGKEDLWRRLQALAQDVERRVAAGDLPRSDALLAQQEVISAHMALTAAAREAKVALARFTLLTGMRRVPALDQEPLPAATEPVAVHISAAQAAERRARAAVAAATAQPASAPTITLSMRREREGTFSPNARSIGVSLQIPLVGKLRDRAVETAAATQMASASAELVLTEARVESELELAQSQLFETEERLRQSERRADATQEHTRLFQQAFKLGERSLAELLRSQIQSHDAQMTVRQERIRVGQARAELNQALGIIP